MDIATIAGIGIGMFLVVFSIVLPGASILTYLDLPSFMMTMGGSFAALFVSNPLSQTLRFFKYMTLTFKVPHWEEERIISSLVNFSEKARREGLLALEDDLEEVEDEFLRKGIQLVVDGTDPEIIKNVLLNDLSQMQSRHAEGIKLFDDWSKLAPAFGMIGTVVGLIGMLANLSDTSSIGRNMGLALITTLYGALWANLIAIPMKSKLEGQDSAEGTVKEIMIEGILSIQSGDNPRILEEKLISFLPPDRRAAVKQESTKE
jgi:chemotaxis protein MotA